MLGSHHNAFAPQKSTCKDLGRNGQRPTITPKATYTPTSTRGGSRSLKIRRLPNGTYNNDRKKQCRYRQTRVGHQ
ncbi:hypothetical protein DB330_05105 [Lacticaseibacillus casei]|nr:hypothetical protein [Lacticaseibacillus casei]PTU96931.1 hypothetical protein DB330_05105 [Lacticaseibacillus casei]PTU98935.1 hypothetical protein DB326_05060 [Lacticaseibacillus casei]RXS57710.1 hypothetical protein ETB94_04990 [Lacticaseibacillus casei]TLF34933.1 hypothetical protein FEI10_05125 [Lacticaseibacillus casei]